MKAIAPISAVLEFVLLGIQHNILSKLLCHITIIKTMDSGERGMNPVAITIINLRKEYWP